MLSVVFCVGEANDSDPEPVVPELVSTLSMTSTGGGVYGKVVGVPNLTTHIGFRRRAAGRATGGVAVHKPGIIYWHHECVIWIHGDPFNRGYCWCIAVFSFFVSGEYFLYVAHGG